MSRISFSILIRSPFLSPFSQKMTLFLESLESIFLFQTVFPYFQLKLFLPYWPLSSLLSSRNNDFFPCQRKSFAFEFSFLPEDYNLFIINIHSSISIFLLNSSPWPVKEDASWKKVQFFLILWLLSLSYLPLISFWVWFFWEFVLYLTHVCIFQCCPLLRSSNINVKH